MPKVPLNESANEKQDTSGDGVALTSARHPYAPEHLQRVADAIARVQCGPNFDLRAAEAAIDADTTWMLEHESDIDPAALETVSVDIGGLSRIVDNALNERAVITSKVKRWSEARAALMAVPWKPECVAALSLAEKALEDWLKDHTHA